MRVQPALRLKDGAALFLIGPGTAQVGGVIRAFSPNLVLVVAEPQQSEKSEAMTAIIQVAQGCASSAGCYIRVRHQFTGGSYETAWIVFLHRDFNGGGSDRSDCPGSNTGTGDESVGSLGELRG